MRYSPATIRQFLHEQATGRRGVAAFCAEHRLKVSTFYAWRKRYGRMEATSPQAGFCQITPAAAPVRRSLILPSGLRLEIDGLNTNELAELLLEIDRADA